MIRASLWSVVVLSAVYGCSGNPVDIGALDSGTDGEGGSGCSDKTHCKDSSVDVGVDQSNGEGGPSTCRGTAPNCFGNDDTQCCGQDPSGPATCVGGAWKCGSANAPGCNGKSCLLTDSGIDAGVDTGIDAGADTGIDTGIDTGVDAGPDASSDVSSTCPGPQPLCFGTDDTMCCGHDPFGTAACIAGSWMCGASLAPGCNGKMCFPFDSGPPTDGPIPPIDAFPPPYDAPPPFDVSPPPYDAAVPDGFIACGPTPCPSTEACVVSKNTGPVCLAPNDAGTCPPPYVMVGACCTFETTSYSCHKLPGSCGGTPSCGCAKSLCGVGCTCTGATGDDLDCSCML